MDVVEGDAPAVEGEEDADGTKAKTKEIIRDCGAPTTTTKTKAKTKTKSKSCPPRKTFPHLGALSSKRDFCIDGKIKTPLNYEQQQ